MVKAILKTEPSYILELSGEEAQTLLDIGEMVGGCPRTSRRKHMDAIRASLEEAGMVSDADLEDVHRQDRVIRFLTELEMEQDSVKNS